jgi:hypothetical protein
MEDLLRTLRESQLLAYGIEHSRDSGPKAEAIFHYLHPTGKVLELSVPINR